MSKRVERPFPPVASSDVRGAVLFAVALVAFLLKLWLAATTFGTNDVQTFELMLEKLNTKGAVALYQEGTDVTIDGKLLGASQMNHPPFVLTLLRVWDALCRASGQPLGFWIRTTCAIADLGALWLIWRMLGTKGENWLALMILAIAPAAILISGFHGNTDPIMIALVVLAVYFMERGSVAFAGAAFALACSVKVWPLVLAPVFLLSAKTMVRRIVLFLCVLLVAVIAGLPWFFLAPTLILNQVFGYGSIPGWWGITYLRPEAYSFAKTAVFSCVFAGATFMYQRVRSVFGQCALVAMLFLFLTPGFGPQYIAWVNPWTVAAGWRGAAAFHLSAGVFLCGMYMAWSLGFPLSFANAHKNPIPPVVLHYGVIAWATIPVLMIKALRRHYRPIIDC